MTLINKNRNRQVNGGLSLSVADLPTYDRGGMEGYSDYTEL
jgi:hypothetical protein